MKRFAIAAAAAGMVAAQDPAQGWLAYAQGKFPGGTRITFIEAYWKVGATPRQSNSFYSPWFGMDPPDNLNLLQPVNPWMGNEWVAYTEYFQWSPEHNQNSNQFNVKAGDQLHGTITYRPDTNSYDVYQSVVGGQSVTMNIPIQKKNGSYKNYSIPYFVYEKVAPCGDYPGDEIVSFTNITIEYDGKDVTEQVQWTTAYVDEVCDFAAKVINNPLEIQITWNTKAADPPASLIEASQSDRGFGLRRPAKTVGAGAAPAAAALA